MFRPVSAMAALSAAALFTLPCVAEDAPEAPAAEAPAPEAAAAEAPAPADADPAVIVIGGKPAVLRSELDARVKEMLARSPFADAGEEFLAMMRPNVARQLAMQRVLLDEAHSINPGMKFVLIEPFLLPVGSWKEKWDESFEKMRRLQEVVARVAADYGAVHVPLQRRFFELCRVREEKYWLWDGVHPTEAGHGVVAFEWMERAKDIL